MRSTPNPRTFKGYQLAPDPASQGTKRNEAGLSSGDATFTARIKVQMPSRTLEIQVHMHRESSDTPRGKGVALGYQR